MPRSATYAMTVPRTVRPHPARGPLARSMKTPSPMSRTGRSQRPEPNQGAITLRIQSVRAPLPGSRRPTSTTTPRTSRITATMERVTSELRRGRDGPPGVLRLVRRERAGGFRRRVVT